MKKILHNCSVSRSLLTATMLVTAIFISCGNKEPDDSSSGGPVGGHSTIAAVQNVECTSDAIPVAMQNSQFTPYNLQAPADSIVQWTNYDAVPHRVTSDETPERGFFESDYIGKGEFVCFKFTGDGTYQYHCSNHMDGIITIITPTTL